MTETEQDFEHVVRESMRDKISWDLLVSDEAVARRALAALKNMLARVNADLAGRGGEMGAAFEEKRLGNITQRRYSERLNEYVAWKKRATYFRSVLVRRHEELVDRFRDSGRKAHVVRREERAEKMEKVLLVLATRLYQFEYGDLDKDTLCAVLDEFKLPLGKTGVLITLRDAIDEGRLDRFFQARPDIDGDVR